MFYVNKNQSLNLLEDLIKQNLNKKLEGYMSESLNRQFKEALELFQKRVFLEQVIEECTAFNKKQNWDDSLTNLILATTVEDLVEVFKLRSEVYTSIEYQDEFPDTLEGLNFDIYDTVSAVICYKNGGKITGTTRLIFDSSHKLPSEEKFSFDTIRRQYPKIGELSRLIAKNGTQGLGMEFKNLMKGAYWFFMLNDIDITLLGIKKEHYKLYSRFGGSQIIAELGNYGKLNLEALILTWNPSEVSDFFKRSFLK